MVSILKIMGILSCGFLLCLGLSHAVLASNVISAGDETAPGQSDREGGQSGLRGDHDKLKGGYTTGGERYGGQSGLRSDHDKLKGSSTTGGDRYGGQGRLRGDQDKLKANHTTESER